MTPSAHVKQLLQEAAKIVAEVFSPNEDPKFAKNSLQLNTLTVEVAKMLQAAERKKGSMVQPLKPDSIMADARKRPHKPLLSSDKKTSAPEKKVPAAKASKPARKR